MEESEIMYNSEFLPSVRVVVVFENNSQYESLKEHFDEYGYGFMVPGNNMIIIDGEQLVNGLGPEALKFIEAHEISHVIMGHDGPRNEDEELDADLGAYILLSKSGKTDSIKSLLKNFKNRHGVRFSKKLLDRVIHYFN
jgi:hypothetical protein